MNLIFFDENGNYRNVSYDEITDTYNASLIFPENGSDTFKTLPLYVFEEVKSFEFKSSDLELQKFQLFNEYGFNITGSIYINQSVTKIQTTNGQSSFYSKWIYGQNFESKFPIGSEIIFDNPIFEFTNSLKTYTVVSTKKNAILIISSLDNKSFNTSYQFLSGLTSSYSNCTISGINSIGISRYLNSNYDLNLSSWSEPTFFQNLYKGRKLNIINTTYNNKVVSISETNFTDKVYYSYNLPSTELSNGSDLLIEIILKSDHPIVYNGGIEILSDKIVFWNAVSKSLKPGTQFIIFGTNNNTGNLNVGQIPSFINTNQQTYYATASQVLWNNIIYQSIQSYTQSATSSITPDNTDYWTSNITYLPISQLLTPEVISYSEIYLTSNKFYYGSSASINSDATIAFASEKYYQEFSNFNINLYSDIKGLHADLNLSSEYATVNYYSITNGVTYSIGTYSKYFEKTIGIDSNLTQERDNNISQIYSYNIVFTELDEFGIIININGLVYQVEIQWVYSGSNIDMKRTIDKTLRNWLSNHYVSLYNLGIISSLDYLVNYPYIYFDSLILKSFYPNVPLNFKVSVGSTANYYIEHSEVIFYEIGNILSININNIQYSITYSSSVSNTLLDWTKKYSSILSEYGIFISSKNNTLYFNKRNIDTTLSYTITVGQSSSPGNDLYKITNKIFGNIGSIITSNSAVLQDSSFININGPSSLDYTGFATGMIISINNTLYPYVNQEYNLVDVSDKRITFSYQGPFWGGTGSLYNSPFFIPAFSNGFESNIIPNNDSLEGAYDPQAFDPSFSTLNQSYSYTYNLMPSKTTNLVDIIYLNNSDAIYTLGKDIIVYDGLSGDYIDKLSLPGLSYSLKLNYNPIDSYLYVLSSTIIYKIDPNTNFISSTFSVSNPYDIITNQINGDIYISYFDRPNIDIIDINENIYGITSSYLSNSYGTYEMSFNFNENKIYILTGDNIVLRVNGTTRLEDASFNINSIGNSIEYNQDNNSIYIVGNYLYKIFDNSISTIPISGTTFSDILYNNISGNIDISLIGTISSVDSNDNIDFSLVTSEYGYLSINQYDQRMYTSSQNTNEVYISDSINGTVYSIIGLTSSVRKLVYNPIRKSMWGIMPNINYIIELSVDISSTITNNLPENYYNGGYEYQYGILDPNYIVPDSIWLKARTYIRKPRENYVGEQQVQWIWKWLSDDVSDIFLYDFSGSQLPTTGTLAYIGEKPLKNAYLNYSQNQDTGKTASSEYQQTVFDEIVYDIDYINSSVDLSFTPEPMEVFMGFNSKNEGVVSSTLLLLKRENINVSIITNYTNNNIITFSTGLDSSTYEIYGMITLDINSVDNFLYDSNGNNRGLKVGQLVQISIKDNTNNNNKYISYNDSIVFIIKEIYIRSIKVKFITNIFTDETTKITNYPIGSITYLSTSFKVLDKELARFSVSGQTEIEDVRYLTELTNIGKNITTDDVFIFKTYNIDEQGVDWNFLNKKRKEMLYVKDTIYPYIGSYKSIINAINYFGYNDLKLYEYYLNINTDSKDFGKYVKVEIPDIFDNTVPGWTVNDFLKKTMPNPNYEDTNLFNLTYLITDINGNNLLLYSIDEVIIKLQGLKSWLQRNIIPISHKILDITGRADFPAPNYVLHKNYIVKTLTISESMSPFDFKINEAYLMPVNTGSSVYNVLLDFYNQSIDYIPDYFTIKIKTYQIFPEWYPFTTYNNGDIVSYYDVIYKSVIDGNKLNDPRKYSNTSEWSANFEYIQGQIVEYKRNFYEFLGTQSTPITPFYDVLNSIGNWINVTQWIEIDYLPIQTIKEFRTGTQSFQFTIDTNIDPFISAEVTSDNGYGQVFTVKKNYKIEGLSSNNQTEGTLDVIGPIKVYNFLTSTTTTTTTINPNPVISWQPIDPYCQDDGITTTSTTTTTTTAPTTTTTTTTSTSTTTTTLTTTTTTTTTTTSTTTTTTTLPATIVTVYAQAQSSVTIPVVSFYYTINGGAWTLLVTANVTDGAYSTIGTINVNVGDIVVIAPMSGSNDLQFGSGNGGPYSGLCGESLPYSLGAVVTSTPAYLNLAVVANAFVIC